MKKQNEEKIIAVREVRRKYELGEKGFWALKGVNLNIMQGEFIAIVGKSGSGKSTLLNLIGGLDRPTEGKISFDGKELNSFSENKLSRLRGENIGFIFQFFQLMPTLTVLENIMMPMEFSKNIPSSKRKVRAEQLLLEVGILDQADKFPSALSGGEQQRVGIARAMANDPKIILADEPTGNLDTQTTEEIFRLLETLVSEGKCVIMVTHNEDLAKRCDRLIRIQDGMIIEDALSDRNRR
jgi:putative ABC transport system ATP-binding protein